MHLFVWNLLFQLELALAGDPSGNWGHPLIRCEATENTQYKMGQFSVAYTSFDGLQTRFDELIQGANIMSVQPDLSQEQREMFERIRNGLFALKAVYVKGVYATTPAVCQGPKKKRPTAAQLRERVDDAFRAYWANENFWKESMAALLIREGVDPKKYAAPGGEKILFGGYALDFLDLGCHLTFTAHRLEAYRFHFDTKVKLGNIGLAGCAREGDGTYEKGAEEGKESSISGSL